MTRHTCFGLLAVCIILCALLVGCGGGSTIGGNPNPTPGPVPTVIPPGDGDTLVIGSPGLCNNGDVARVDVNSEGKARFALVSDVNACSPLKDNRQEEYTLILYNLTNGPISFRLDSPRNELPPTARAQQFDVTINDIPNVIPPVATADAQPTGPNSMSRRAYEQFIQNRPAKYDYGRYSPTNLGQIRGLMEGDEIEFRVRNSVDDADSFVKTSAVLRKQGQFVNVFLDRDIPFDANNLLSPDAFTQAHVDRIAQIVDQNSYPLVTQLLGDPSDVDNDGRVTVLISPIINRDLGVTAYVDPRNVLPFDPVTNPISNEAEVIFLAAPDSLGQYSQTSLYQRTGSRYTSDAFVNGKIIHGWIAFQLPKLISFYQKVLIGNGQDEDDWILDGLGAVMADLAGFNIFRGDVWFSLALPSLDSLLVADDLDTFDFQGAEYLFMTYYIQSQLDQTFQDSNGDGIDDDVDFIRQLMTSGLTGLANLENAVVWNFDASKETKFQSIFKDWTIAVATSGSQRTDLQQSDQSAVKYYLNLNPVEFGPGICNNLGSVRVGAENGDGLADGYDVGIDLNGYQDDLGKDVLLENADEHVFAPGNPFFGYIDSYAAMYVRLAGLFQAKQTISISASNSNIRGFLIKRTGQLTYPKTYSESLFGSINQHHEDLSVAGPNPYWTSRGQAMKLNFEALVASANAEGFASEFLSIIGTIDSPSAIQVCPANIADCSNQPVPDTDKYLINIPVDGGDLAIAVRRQFDQGSDQSQLKPMLAIVSAKDVPYPYLPHPVRSEINGVNTTDTRQQYRWLTNKLVCGDDQDTGDTSDFNYVIANPEASSSCQVRSAADSDKIIFEGLIENSGSLPIVTDPSTVPVSVMPWSGDILGGQCHDTPDQLAKAPIDARATGYGVNGVYPVTTIERSPSSLGGYAWSDSFMEVSYNGSAFPDVLFSREFLQNVSGYPSIEPDSLFDPRSINALTLNCHVDTGGAEPDETTDAPDDFLEPNELTRATSLAEQVLIEMSRGRFASDGSPESLLLQAQYDAPDLLVIDGDSRDEDSVCTTVDIGNNVNTYTVRSGEGSIVWGNFTSLIPHLTDNLSASVLLSAQDANQAIYQANPGPSGEMILQAGKTYAIIVSGMANSIGNYEIRIRKINPNRIVPAVIHFAEDHKNVKCYYEN